MHCNAWAILCLVLVSGLVILFSALAGAAIDRASAPAYDHYAEMISPSVSLPDDGETVGVVYPGGSAIVVYLGTQERHTWIVENWPSGEAGIPLSELYGDPIWWYRLPEIPSGLSRQWDFDRIEI